MKDVQTVAKEHKTVISQNKKDGSVTIEFKIREHEYDEGAHLRGLIFDIMAGIHEYSKTQVPESELESLNDLPVVKAARFIRISTIQNPEQFNRRVRGLIALQSLTNTEASREFVHQLSQYADKFAVTVTVTGEKEKTLSWKYQPIDPF